MSDASSTLSQQLSEYVAACFSGLWIHSQEHDDAIQEMAQLARQENWRLAVWDVARGLTVLAAGEPSEAVADVSVTDPLAALGRLDELADPQRPVVFTLVNFHRFLGSAEIVQTLIHRIAQGKQNRTFLAVLSPVIQIPVELDKQFVILTHALPDRGQIEQIARGIATEEGELPRGDELAAVLDAACGLTRLEAEGAFSLSLVRDGAIRPQAIWQLKQQTLKKSGLLTLHRGGESFADLGGLEALKAFCRQVLRQQGQTDPLRRPRGVLLLGVPGTGKSAFCRGLGRETNRPTLILDVGAMLGSLVGQTESNIRQALAIADAMAPCILFIDEIDKALAGAPSGTGDSGVSARLFGTLLTYLSDRTSDVFVVASANDITKLPPEFSRAERWDAVYFLDLPGAVQKQAIWDIWRGRFQLDPSLAKPRSEDWTGAEIRACCRLAAMLGVSLREAADHVVPVATMAAEKVQRLRDWAAGRCLDADQPGIYHRGSGSQNAPGAAFRVIRR